jgi:hypothetical protein
MRAKKMAVEAKLKEEVKSVQVVTFTLPAAWFAILMSEIDWACRVYASAPHHPTNCTTLYKLLMEQAGTTVSQNETKTT